MTSALLEPTLSQTLEDVYVQSECAGHGRSVRVVLHEDTGVVEVVGCDARAVKRTCKRLASGNYTVRASVVIRPSNAELA